MGYKGTCMYCFEMPPCSHLTNFLHPNGERKVLPSSPLITSIVPCFPSLVSLISLTLNTSPLCPSPTSLLWTIFFRAALVPPAEQSQRGVSPGLEEAHRQAARSCCQLQASGVRENCIARRDISGKLATFGNRKALLLYRYQE